MKVKIEIPDIVYDSIKIVTDLVGEINGPDPDKLDVILINAVAKGEIVNDDEPKLVLHSGDGYADGAMVYDIANCPECNWIFEEGDSDWGMPYCPYCGTRLNWEANE